MVPSAIVAPAVSPSYIICDVATGVTENVGVTVDVCVIVKEHVIVNVGVAVQLGVFVGVAPDFNIK